MDLMVPECIHGLLIAENVALDRKVDGSIIFFGELFKNYLLLAANYFVQGYLLYVIWRVDREIIKPDDSWWGPPDCEDDHHIPLKLVCVFVFEVSVFTDLKVCALLCSILWNVTTKLGNTFTLLEREDVDAGGAILAARVHTPRRQSKMEAMFKRVRPRPPVGMKQWDLVTMTRIFKVASFAIVAFPKTLVGVVLGYYGGLFVAEQKGIEDLIMNALAMGFILNVDTFMYTAFTADVTKDNLRHMKPVMLQITNNERWSMWLFSTILYPIVVISATCFIVHRSTMLSAEACS